MNQSAESALFWIWDSLRNRQLWMQMQSAVSPVSQQMLECFQDWPCRDSCWWPSRAVSSSHWAGSASLLQVSPAWQCCRSAMLAWFQGCGTPGPSSGVLCLALLGHAAEPGCWFATWAAVLQSKLNCSAVPHSRGTFWSLGRSMWLSLHCHNSPWLSWSGQF